MLTKGRIDRTGRVVFHDASLAVWEDGISEARNTGGWEGEKAWSRAFKRDVFARIIQTLNRLGWTVGPWDRTEHYKAIAHNHRTCAKGDLQAELSVSGRHIEFKVWQDVQNVENPNGGRYDFDKERRMTYLQRLEMERTRQRIRDYLCNVFTGYVFEPPKAERGPDGITAVEWIEQNYRESWHFDKKLGRPSGDESSYNNKSADGSAVRHGARVWFADWHGRMLEGTAYYNINNMWWVVSGEYGLNNIASFDIYTSKPENLRIKRNARQRRKRLERELSKATEAMNFERAAVLRDILFPGSPALYVVWHEGHNAYHSPGFNGYTQDKTKAGKFTADEVHAWNTAPNKVIELQAA